MRRSLLTLHRWIALIATPLFLLITLTGVILAFRPILADLGSSASVYSVPTEQVAALVERLPGNAIRDIQTLDENSVRVSGVGDYALDSGALIGDGSDPLQSFFGTVQNLHKSLLLRADWLTQTLTYLMLGVILAGVFLGLPRIRNTLIGWHQMLAWGLLPLLILIPFTAVLMTLHIGAPELPIKPGGGRVDMQQALARVSEYPGGEHLVAIRGFKGGSMLVTLAEGRLVVTADAITPLSDEPYWPKELHEGTWAGAWSGSLNAIGGLVLVGLTLTGALSWIRRTRGNQLQLREREATTLVAFASQTGRALALAQDTRQLLQQAGEKVDLMPLGNLGAADLAAYRQILLLVSTTGEGDTPDSLRGWADTLRGEDMSEVRFSLLALGDRGYSHFCGGGHQVRDILLECGALELTEPVEADGDPAEYWQQWLSTLSPVIGLSLVVIPDGGGCEACTATLIERSRLEQGNDGGESYAIRLSVPEHLSFSPGDLLSVKLAEGGERLYSIGSSSQVTPGEIQLTVGLLRYVDDQGQEQLGRGSSEVCLNWQPGSEHAVSIRHHPGFNPPEDESTPVVLVATGCGIAPFLGFIEQRAAAGPNRGPIWLVFGNRYREQDYFYRDYLQRQVEAGVIQQIDTLFSRDGERQRYVTERLVERGEQLLEWLFQGGRLYACGRASTLGYSFDQALRRILSDAGLSPEQVASTLDEWSRNGVVKRDFFG
ncbi:PepSY domain-containing protein [Marinobacterium lacunae]|nr:PepSY domain-containing protein [Marinobacterium lacunae]